jgi:hypothetical protein
MDQADVDDDTREGLTSLRPLLLRDTRQHQADGCPLIERSGPLFKYVALHSFGCGNPEMTDELMAMMNEDLARGDL